MITTILARWSSLTFSQPSYFRAAFFSEQFLLKQPQSPMVQQHFKVRTYFHSVLLSPRLCLLPSYYVEMKQLSTSPWSDEASAVLFHIRVWALTFMLTFKFVWLIQIWKSVIGQQYMPHIGKQGVAIIYMFLSEILFCAELQYKPSLYVPIIRWLISHYGSHQILLTLSKITNLYSFFVLKNSLRDIWGL